MHLDITDKPELRALAREVSQSQQPRVLEENGVAVAVLTPIQDTPCIQPQDPEVIRELLAEMAGTFASLDTAALKRELRDQRDQASTGRPSDD